MSLIPTVLDSIAKVRQTREQQIIQGKIAGLVPTMGAIHQGHLSLIETALKDCDFVYVSIFVNPSQFSPTEDLDRYPRTLEADLEKIQKLNTLDNIFVFVPAVSDIYPNGIPLQVSAQTGAFVQVIGLSEQLEGSTRPHFFRGVATVVSKFFNIVSPNFAYFGQKDIQQCIVIKKLVSDLFFNLQIKIVPTARDPVDGLALSSRNVYLTPKQRKHAPAVYRGLHKANTLFEHKKSASRSELIKCVLNSVEKEGSEHFQFDYICVSDKSSLLELDHVNESGAIISCAWKMGTTRLIDNIVLGAQI
ncbi:hypothetical protein BB560_004032 [Smittium megazygosporum]|uniref:Pantoate--beta-alanine ligase n=1 Tax=Smittium megazygosporum TaxID=133381 RepID=A0A2T9ZAC7_9FUNG|nr:hypothetical protein BB560_004032 [Smittium megazygosporum]